MIISSLLVTVGEVFGVFGVGVRRGCSEMFRTCSEQVFGPSEL